MLRKIVDKIERSFFDPLREFRSSKRDIRLLCERISEIKNYSYHYKKAQSRLEEAHRHYTTQISPGGSAASLELACFLDIWCQLRQPSYVLDLGSGFSSYVFRSYQKASERKIRVVSVDSSKEWLSKTKEYLRSNGLSVEELIHSDSLPNLDFSGVDLGFFDIRPLEARTALFQPVYEKMPNGGAIVVDDVHKPHFRPHVRKEAAKLSGKLYNLKKVTFDSYQRYSYLYIK